MRWANPDVLKYLDCPLDSLFGRPYLELFPGSEGSLPILEEAARAGKALELRGHSYPAALGDAENLVYLDSSYVPVHGDGNELVGYLLVSADATARIENERLQQERLERLVEIDRLKDNFINAASHELRTPLTSIRGYTEFLEEELGGPLSPQQLEYVSQIQEGAIRLQRIVDDMLDFARLEAGTFQLQQHEADLGSLIAREVTSLSPQALQAGVSLCVEVPAEPVSVWMDASRVGQVILNLVGNAIKFTQPGGQVTVRLQRASEGVRLEVRDTGIGIAPEHQGRLFDKFFQVDPSTTRERGGAGLGLSISKALVEAHAGAIGFESEPGTGTTFHVTLPYGCQQARQDEQARESDAVS